MTKQILKSLGAASVVAAVTAIFCVSGQAADVRANVPFSFEVNGATLPPGTYILSTNQSQLLVRGVSRSAIVLTNGLQSMNETQPKLVFHKYGDEYIMTEVWTSGFSGRVLPKSERERQLAKGEGSRSKTATFERVEIPLS
jgi:hypothetical protein